MAEPNIVLTLQRKRDEIERAIAAYEKKIEQARIDLASVNATLRLFKQDADPESRVYLDTLRLFKRGELVAICKKVLAEEGTLDTRELATRVIRARGLDVSDRVLRTSITYRIVQAMRLQAKRGKVATPNKRGNVRVWTLR